jgi:excisionase family DNA binding protein
MTGTTIPPADAPAAALLGVRGVASMLGCSPRHVYRLADAGKMPRPIRLGALVRWRRTELTDWIAAGCPAVEGRAGRDPH